MLYAYILCKMKRINIYIKPSIKIIKVETLTTLASSPGWNIKLNDTISESDALSKQNNTNFGLWNWDNSKLFQKEQFDESEDLEY